MIEQSAEYLAPFATIIGAFLTASNLGSRITGYGFVVFTLGSLGWVALGLVTDQMSLIAANGVLLVLNAFGIYRWLGREAKHEDAGQVAAEKSRENEDIDMAGTKSLIGSNVRDERGESVGTLTEAMFDMSNKRVLYFICDVSGSVGGCLKALKADELQCHSGQFVSAISASVIGKRKTLDDEAWPTMRELNNEYLN